MENTNIYDKILEKFISYLSDQDISSKSLKNYKSDISHFSAWLILKIRSWGVYANQLTEAVPFISQNTAGDYCKYLETNKIPESTINRRLSSLRHLSSFLVNLQILDFNFMDGVSNVNTQQEIQEEHPLLLEFEKHLKNGEVSKSTIKNYKSDVRQFIQWLERKQKMYPEAN